MKNTLRFALIIIGAGLIAFGVLTLFFPKIIRQGQMEEGFSQSVAILIFGGLCLLSGLAYKRKKR